MLVIIIIIIIISDRYGHQPLLELFQQYFTLQEILIYLGESFTGNTMS